MTVRLTSYQVRGLMAHTRPARRYKPGVMNSTEAKYADHLEILKLAGEIAFYEFERVTLKIAPDTRYTADFFVVSLDGLMEFREVKPAKKNQQTGEIGFYAEGDALVKIKSAAERFPYFRFLIVWPVEGNWKEKEIGG